MVKLYKENNTNILFSGILLHHAIYAMYVLC